MRAAHATLHAILRAGGTLLLTVPGITRSCLPDRDAWGDWWRFTAHSSPATSRRGLRPCRRDVEAYGNVLSATAFLYGFAPTSSSPAELDLRDPDFELIIGVRAIKQRGLSRRSPLRRGRAASIGFTSASLQRRPRSTP